MTSRRQSSFTTRWNKLRKSLRYGNFSTNGSLLLARLSHSIGSVALVAWLFWRDSVSDTADCDPIRSARMCCWLIPIITLIGSLPWIDQNW